MIVALTDPYKVYGNYNLYFDGLAYLGYVHLARVIDGYQLKPLSTNYNKKLPELLAKCSGYEKME